MFQCPLPLCDGGLKLAAEQINTCDIEHMSTAVVLWWFIQLDLCTAFSVYNDSWSHEFCYMIKQNVCNCTMLLV